MAAYDQLQWHAFFAGSVGASAALTGLLFVAISLNLAQILKYPRLPGRAAGTLGILLGALAVGSFGLAPGQSARVFGIEVAVTGATVAAQGIWVSAHKNVPGEPLAWTLEPLIFMPMPSLSFLAGGLSLIWGGGGGLYWILGATILSFIVASVNSWVLLVEILR